MAKGYRLCEAARTGTSRQTYREGSPRGRWVGAVPRRGTTSQLTEPEAGGRRLGGSGSHAASSGRGRAQRCGEAARDASCASVPVTSAPAGAGSRGGAARVRRTGRPDVLLAEGGRCERGRRRLRLQRHVKQEFPQSTNPERAARLVVELDNGLSSRPGRRRDRKSGRWSAVTICCRAPGRTSTVRFDWAGLALLVVATTSALLGVSAAVGARPCSLACRSWRGGGSCGGSSGRQRTSWSTRAVAGAIPRPWRRSRSRGGHIAFGSGGRGVLGVRQALGSSLARTAASESRLASRTGGVLSSKEVSSWLVHPPS